MTGPPAADVMVWRTFLAKYPNSFCLFEPDPESPGVEHRIRRGDRIGNVRRADNPLILYTGVVCRNCVKELPRAREVASG